MKKVLFFGAIVTLVGLTSCKKEWTCECNVFGTTISAKTEKMTKADAKKDCEDGSNGMCKIKN
ncbi:MAG TPA: hypothetical protein PLI97_04970 [Fluviicola sp.]|nr:hypothetical protein [Fluviicola sp.]